MSAVVQRFSGSLQVLSMEAKDLCPVVHDGPNLVGPLPNLLVLGEDNPSVLARVPYPGRVLNVLTIVCVDVSHGLDCEAKSPQRLGYLPTQTSIDEDDVLTRPFPPKRGLIQSVRLPQQLVRSPQLPRSNAPRHGVNRRLMPRAFWSW